MSGTIVAFGKRHHEDRDVAAMSFYCNIFMLYMVENSERHLLKRIKEGMQTLFYNTSVYCRAAPADYTIHPWTQGAGLTRGKGAMGWNGNFNSGPAFIFPLPYDGLAGGAKKGWASVLNTPGRSVSRTSRRY